MCLLYLKNKRGCHTEWKNKWKNKLLGKFGNGLKISKGENNKNDN